eukprot:jgi/Picre1/31339/NNA_006692.t1
MVIEDLEGIVDGTEWSPRDCSDKIESDGNSDEAVYGLEMGKQDAVYSYAGRGRPVHIYDGYTGGIRGSYVAMDATRDEMVSVYSVAFSGSGQFLYGGGISTVYVFDVTCPGKYSDGYLLKSVDDTQQGIISSVVPGVVGTALEHVVAVGSYGTYGAGLHDIRSREMICLLEGHSGEGSQRGRIKRFIFDIEPSGRHLASGGDDGRVSIYDLRDGKPVSAFQAAPDCVNGCHFHPSEALLATSHGERQFSSPDIDSDEESQVKSNNLIGLWAFDTCNLIEET